MNLALIVAAGKSRRFGDGDKQFAPALERPLLYYSVNAFARADAVDKLLLVVPEEAVERCRVEAPGWADKRLPVTIVAGGAERQDSVYAGLKACPSETELVWVHDGARPLIEPEWINRLAFSLGEHDGIILGAPVVDTVKQVGEDGLIKQTIDRRLLWLAQTPQLFRFSVLYRAHQAAQRENASGTDDSTLVERLAGKVVMLAAAGFNIKVTTPSDIELVEETIKRRGL